jgi:hypothetical protein
VEIEVESRAGSPDPLAFQDPDLETVP